MTERERFEFQEQRAMIFARDGWRCVVCGAPIRAGHPQLAHRIPQTAEYFALYGARVIHDPLNLASVCSLACNSAVNIGRRPLEVEELAHKIAMRKGN
jgi:hypothetical protein